MEIDVSSALGAGVYVLRRRGSVVFVGYAQTMMALINGHRYNRRHSAHVWDPVSGIDFDAASVIPCGPDRAKSILAELIETHDPIHNRPVNLDAVRCSLETIRPRTSSASSR